MSDKTTHCFHSRSYLEVRWSERRSTDIIRLVSPIVFCSNCHLYLPDTEEPAKSVLNNLKRKDWDVEHQVVSHYSTARFAH